MLSMTNKNSPLLAHDETVSLALPQRYYGAEQASLLNTKIAISGAVFAVLLYIGVFINTTADFPGYFPLSYVFFVVAAIFLAITLVGIAKIVHSNDKLREASRTTYVNTVFVPWMKNRYNLTVSHKDARRIMVGEAVVLPEQTQGLRVGLKQDSFGEIFLENVVDLNEFMESKRTSATDSGGGPVIVGSDTAGSTRFSVEGLSSGGDGGFSDSGSDGGGGDGGGGGGGD